MAKPETKTNVVPMAEETGHGANFSEIKELQQYIERIEELESDKQEIGKQVGSIKKEAAQSGIATNVLNEILRDRRRMHALGKDGWDDMQSNLERYRESLGDFFTNRLQMSLPIDGE